MALDATAAIDPKAKLVIRNIGVLLSGDIAQPILDADTLVAVGAAGVKHEPAQRPSGQPDSGSAARRGSAGTG